MKKLGLLLALVIPAVVGWVLGFMPMPVSGVLAIIAGLAVTGVAVIIHFRHHGQIPTASLAEYLALGTLAVLLYLAIL